LKINIKLILKILKEFTDLLLSKDKICNFMSYLNILEAGQRCTYSNEGRMEIDFNSIIWACRLIKK